MSKQAKMSVAIFAAFALVVIGLMAVVGSRDTPAKPAPAAGSAEGTGTASGDGGAQLVRADSHVLGEKAGTGVEFVEFLDFECEGCRAAYPAVEQLREDYAGRVTFVARYFPMPGHFNAERAARAVEAAAQQGKFEAMYSRMYETQEQWGEQQVPLDDLFRGFAGDLGLDMTKFDRDYADPATAARVKKDQADGLALGVQGTPTFFINGQQVQPRDYTDLTDALDAALAE